MSRSLSFHEGHGRVVVAEKPMVALPVFRHILVGGWAAHLKNYACQMGSYLPQKGEIQKHIWFRPPWIQNMLPKKISTK